MDSRLPEEQKYMPESDKASCKAGESLWERTRAVRQSEREMKDWKKFVSNEDACYN